MKTLFNAVLLVPFITAAVYAYDTPGTGVAWNADSLVANSAGAVTGSFPDYTIAEMITVSSADHLFLVPGTRLVFTQNNAGITVNGSFSAVGVPDSRISFEGSLGQPDSWAGVLFEDASIDSLCRLVFCDIRDAETALNCQDASPVVTGCSFTNNSDPSGSGTGQAVRFSGSNSVFRFNEVADNYQRGMVARGSDLVIENCRFANSNLAPTTFKNRNHLNIETAGGSNIIMTVRFNEFADGAAGAISMTTLNGGSISGTIERNYIHDNSFGIAVGGFGSDQNIDIRIAQNIIEDNNINPDPFVSGSGITLSGGTTDSPVITGNIIRNNHWGITILSSAKPNMGDLSNADSTDDGRNIFLNNGNSGSTFALYNNTAQSQVAENNFWGSNHADSIEAWIFHQPDDGSLGFVDYLPADSTVGPRLVLTGLECPSTDVAVGERFDCALNAANAGLSDLYLTLGDEFGSETAPGGLAALAGLFHRMKNLSPPDRDFSIPGRSAKQAESIVITDPANDFLGRPLPEAGLVYPDVASVDLTFYEIPVVGFFVDGVITFNTTVDTNIVGIISLDTDQDFLTGVFPPFSSLDIADHDVGSEYELVYTTSPTLFPTGASAAVVPSLDTTFTPVGISIAFNTTASTISFTIAFGQFEIDDDFNINVSSGSATTEIVDFVLGGGDFRPSSIPDAAPDVGHGVVGSESGPSWLSPSVRSDTLTTGDVTDLEVSAFAALAPGNYQASVLVGSNDPDAPQVSLPVSFTVTEPELPDVNLGALAVEDSVGIGSSKIVEVSLNNFGGRYRHFILDSAQTGWLSVLPVFTGLPTGGTGQVEIMLDAGSLGTGTYTAHLKVVSNDTLTPVVEVPVVMHVVEVTGLDSDAETGIPGEYRLEDNYPNPFNPVTTIRYALPEQTHVRLVVYNLLGQKVRTLFDGTLEAGIHSARWDAKNDAGSVVGSGVYVYRLEAGKFRAARKLLLLK